MIEKLDYNRMIVYYSYMRMKDNNKKDAIFEATIDLLNEIGFENISMSKIANKAGVSSSTIYVYFENKEDMLKKVYIDVKEKLNAAMSFGIQKEFSSYQVIDCLVRNVATFVTENKSYFLFIEQFSNSPIVNNICQEELEIIFRPLMDIFERGTMRGDLKQASPSILITYCQQPVSQIAKNILKWGGILSEDDICLLVKMSWDAVKA